MGRATLALLALGAALCGAPAGASSGLAARAPRFLACLGAGTPAFAPGSARFANLSALGFRNAHAAPAAVVLARTPAHVADAVRCARRAGVRVCARSGGHSLVGASVCAGVVVDVGPMRRVSVDGAGVATVGAGANMGELLSAVWGKRRWVAAGVCPGVGVAGYTFGGGHGPYEGSLGMMCDALVDVTLVDRWGKVIVASQWRYPELFWGLCGAGGGQFGIVTSFRVRTAPSRFYDRGVVFRVTWEQRYAGEMLAKWADYGEHGGKVWFRVERLFGEFMDGYGACFDVESVDDCLERLEEAEFFRTPGRNVSYIAKVDNALDLHAFFGPEGGWGRFRAKNLTKALLKQRYVGKGDANGRSYQSTFMRADKRPSKEFWQKWADFCADPKLPGIPWVVCESNLFNNAIDTPRNNAFAHRGANVITHYIIGGGSEKERMTAYNWMKNHFAPYTSGVYVNYPELELKNYARMYWGKSLWRLRKLKSHFDPDLLFANPQPIPPIPRHWRFWRRFSK